jgi:hypothetical protein
VEAGWLGVEPVGQLHPEAVARGGPEDQRLHGVALQAERHRRRAGGGGGTDGVDLGGQHVGPALGVVVAVAVEGDVDRHGHHVVVAHRRSGAAGGAHHVDRLPLLRAQGQPLVALVAVGPVVVVAGVVVTLGGVGSATAHRSGGTRAGGDRRPGKVGGGRAAGPDERRGQQQRREQGASSHETLTVPSISGWIRHTYS